MFYQFVLQTGTAPVRRVDVLFCISRFAFVHAHNPADDTNPSPQPAVDVADDVVQLFTDSRVAGVASQQIESKFASKILPFLSQSVQGTLVMKIPIMHGWGVGLAVNPSATLMVFSCSSHGSKGNKLYMYSLPGAWWRACEDDWREGIGSRTVHTA